MAKITDTSQSSAQRVRDAVRNLDMDQSVVRTMSDGFEVPDEVMEEYDRLSDESRADTDATQSQSQRQGQSGQGENPQH